MIMHLQFIASDGSIYATELSSKKRSKYIIVNRKLFVCDGQIFTDHPIYIYRECTDCIDFGTGNPFRMEPKPINVNFDQYTLDYQQRGR